MEDKMNIKKYIHLWWELTLHASQIAFLSRFSAILFTLGKFIRFLLFLFFFTLIASRTKVIGGYSPWQIIFVFCTFNLIDVLAQFFFREVYRFRSYIVTGAFDYILTKPLSPLFRALLGGSDILDLITLLPLLLFMIYVTSRLPGITVIGMLLYGFLIFNSLIIALGFHVIVLSLGILTTEVDNAIWVFRDLTQLGRIPVDVYREPVSFLLTFVIPVAAMITIPAQALFGLVSLVSITTAILFSLIFIMASCKIWQYSIKQYASASS